MVDVDIIQHWNENKNKFYIHMRNKTSVLCISTKAFSNLFQIPENQSDLKKTYKYSGNPNINAISWFRNSGIQIVKRHMCSDPLKCLDKSCCHKRGCLPCPPDHVPPNIYCPFPNPITMSYTIVNYMMLNKYN